MAAAVDPAEQRFDLGNALAVDLLTGKRQIHLQQPTMFYYPGLPQRRFWEVDEFPWLHDMLAFVPQMQADRQAHFEGRAPVYRNEHRIRCKDGSWKWVLSRGMVIGRDDTGRPLRMVGTHTDITELKQAEAQQRALEAQRLTKP